MNTILTILLTLFIIGFFVFIHELGHYAAARKFKVTVKEFAIGMGPKVYSRVSPKTGIRYSLRALPIGGYVSMVGEDETSDDPNALNKKPVWQRMVIMAAGGVMNLLFALLIMIIVVAARGDMHGTTVEEFRSDSTSYSQLYVDDRITHINNRRVRNFMELNYAIVRTGEIVVAEGGEYFYTIVNLTVIRDNQRVNLERVQFRAVNENLRIDFFPEQISRNFFTIIGQGYRESIFIMRMFYDGIGDMIRGDVGLDQMAGPIGMGSMVGETIEQGFVAGLPSLLLLSALISFNLGLLNLVPFPALDGGRLVFLAIEGIRRKPVKPEIEGMIHFAGIVLFMVLMLVLTVSDIGRLF